MKISPVEAELFHADRQTDQQTDTTKVTVAFRSFSNAPKKYPSTHNIKLLQRINSYMFRH